jgi:hypothetical protein
MYIYTSQGNIDERTGGVEKDVIIITIFFTFKSKKFVPVFLSICLCIAYVNVYIYM